MRAAGYGDTALPLLFQHRTIPHMRLITLILLAMKENVEVLILESKQACCHVFLEISGRDLGGTRVTEKQDKMKSQLLQPYET